MSGEREVWWVEEYEGVQFLVSGNSPAEALIMGMPAAAAELNRLLNAYQDAVAALERFPFVVKTTSHGGSAGIESLAFKGDYDSVSDFELRERVHLWLNEIRAALQSIKEQGA